jgi:hypothetical protein
MTFEELFKKSNIEIKDEKHKESLRQVLLRDSYFDEEREVWDWKTVVPSLALSAVLIASAFNVPFSSSPEKVAERNTFYSVLSNNENVSPAEGANALQMVDSNTKTVFYFNDRNVLVNSEVINIK